MHYIGPDGEKVGEVDKGSQNVDRVDHASEE